MSARRPQIAQGKQRHQLRRVLSKALLAHLGEAELALADPKGVFYLGAHTGLEFLGLFAQRTPRRVLLRLAFARTHGHMPVHARGFGKPGRTLLASVCKHDRLFSVKQTMSLGYIVEVGCCSADCVHQPKISIHPDMGFHTEMPLVALLGLVHLGVTLTTAVLGGTGCSNQGDVHHSSCLEHQALGGQGGIDGGQQLDVQIVLFKQMAWTWSFAKPHEGSLLGKTNSSRIEPCKFAIQRGIVQGLFHRRVRDAKPLLQEVNLQQGLNHKRRASSFGRYATGCKRLNQAIKFGPRHHLVHLVEEHAFACSLGDKLKSGGSEADLFHKRSVVKSVICALGFADIP
jgi:hypothetical protein